MFTISQKLESVAESEDALRAAVDDFVGRRGPDRVLEAHARVQAARSRASDLAWAERLARGLEA